MTKTEEKRATVQGPKLIHLDGCPEERVERYEQKGPRGYQLVARCLECGVHVAGEATERPKLNTTEE